MFSQASQGLEIRGTTTLNVKIWLQLKNSCKNHSKRDKFNSNNSADVRVFFSFFVSPFCFELFSSGSLSHEETLALGWHSEMAAMSHLQRWLHSHLRKNNKRVWSFCWLHTWRRFQSTWTANDWHVFLSKILNREYHVTVVMQCYVADHEVNFDQWSDKIWSSGFFTAILSILL